MFWAVAAQINQEEHNVDWATTDDFIKTITKFVAHKCHPPAISTVFSSHRIL